MSLSVFPFWVVLRLYAHIATIECMQIVRRCRYLKGDVLWFAVSILQVHRIVGVTEMLLVAIEVICQSIVHHKRIVVLTDAVVIIAHLDIVIHEELAVAFVVLVISIAIHKACGEGGLGIETHCITRIERFGDDVHQDVAIAIARRRCIVILHLLDFVGGYRLEVIVARHCHIVDKHL